MGWSWPFRRSREAPSPQPIILTWTKAAGLVGIPGAGAAHIDTVAMAGIIAAMTEELAKLYGITLSKQDCLKLALAVAKSGVRFGIGYKIASYVFFYTGVGTVPAMVCNATVNAALTYSTGHAIATTFAKKDSDKKGGDGDNNKDVAELIDNVMKVIPTPPKPT